MSYLPKEVRIIAYFADQRYAKDGAILKVPGFGQGSSLSVAINRAFRDVLKSPEIRHKSPNHIYISVGADGSDPIDFSRRLPAESVKSLVCGGYYLNPA